MTPHNLVGGYLRFRRTYSFYLFRIKASALKRKTEVPSTMSTTAHKTTWFHNPKDQNLNFTCENLNLTSVPGNNSETSYTSFLVGKMIFFTYTIYCQTSAVVLA